MKLWIDAQLSPRLAWWLTETFSVEALAVRDLGLREAKDLGRGEELVEIGDRHKS